MHRTTRTTIVGNLPTSARVGTKECFVVPIVENDDLGLKAHDLFEKMTNVVDNSSDSAVIVHYPDV
jgi:hypothetical protein